MDSMAFFLFSLTVCLQRPYGGRGCLSRRDLSPRSRSGAHDWVAYRYMHASMSDSRSLNVSLCHKRIAMTVLYCSEELGSSDAGWQHVGAVGLGLDLTRRGVQNTLKGGGKPWLLSKSFAGRKGDMCVLSCVVVGCLIFCVLNSLLLCSLSDGRPMCSGSAVVSDMSAVNPRQDLDALRCPHHNPISNADAIGYAILVVGGLLLTSAPAHLRNGTAAKTSRSA